MGAEPYIRRRTSENRDRTGNTRMANAREGNSNVSTLVSSLFTTLSFLIEVTRNPEETVHEEPADVHSI
jgi:hypothetical protein